MTSAVPRTVLILTVTSFLVGGSLAGQQAPPPRLGLPLSSNFSPFDYGAGDRNWTVVEDLQGIVYVGNDKGLLEYDGVEWRLIPLPNRGLVRSLARGPDGRIWVGGMNELGYLSADSLGRTQFVSLLEEVPRERRNFANVWNTLSTGDGTYFSTWGALFRWDGESMDVWPAETRNHHAAVVNDRLYIREFGVGLKRMERSASGDSLRLVPGGERFAERRIYVMLPFDDERMLIGTREEGLFLFDGTSFEPFRTDADETIANGGLYLPGAVLPGGRFALGTLSDGVVIIDRTGSLIHHLNRDTGLLHDIVLYTYTDRSRHLWVTLEFGLARIETGSDITVFDSNTGLSSLLTVTQHQGDLFVGRADGVSRLDRVSGRIEPVDGITAQVFSMLSTGDHLLVAGSQDGLFRLEGGRLERIAGDALAGDAALSVHQWRRDPSVVLVALPDGVAAIRSTPDGWVAAGRITGIGPDVTEWSEGADGTVWVGTRSGQVARLRLDEPQEGPFDLNMAEVRVFDQEDGIPGGDVGPYRVGDDILASGSGDIVLRYDEAAAAFMPETRFESSRTGHPAARTQFRQMPSGQVWITSAHIAPMLAEPDQVGEFELSALRRLRRSRVLGAVPGADGVVWFLSTNRLFRYDPGSGSGASPEVAPLVRSVSMGARELALGGVAAPPSIGHGVEALRFRFTTPGSLVAPLHRTRLDDFDEGWSDWSEVSEQVYTYLPPNDYRFRVESEGGSEAVYAFTVLPPWYRTWLAYLSYVVTIAGMLIGGFRAQRRRLTKKHQELAERRRIEDELRVGHRIQMGMLTTDFPEFESMKVSAALRPAREVGGDLYDVFRLDDRHLCCCVADVSGKGVPAALFMAISKTLVKAIALHQAAPSTRSEADEPGKFEWSTGAIMSSVNDELSHDNDESMFVTAFLCIINIETGKGIYTNAGHNPPYVLHNPDDPRPLNARHGPVLGAVEGIEYGEALVDLNRGEQLLLFTDGVTEAFDEGGNLFTEARLEHFLSGLQSTAAADTVQAVLAEVTEFEGNTEQTDDITVLAVKRE